MATRGSSKVFLVNLTSGKKRQITPEGDGFSYSEAIFARDGKSVLLASDFEREFPALCQIQIGSLNHASQLTVLAEYPKGSLEDFALSPDGKSAVLFWNVSGATQITLLDMNTFTQVEGPRLPAEIASSPTFSPDGRTLAFSLTGAEYEHGFPGGRLIF
jgi:Tol biopolymer transport system component